MIFANILQPIIDVFEAILRFFHDQGGLSWGLSIIALTIVVRALLLPLAVKQFKHQKRMAEHQPEIQKIRERHKGDRERMNKEIMEFMKENNVNPASSCLPLVAQIPVFISLFYMLRSDLRHDICPQINPTKHATKPCGAIDGADFLFIPDLTNKATGWVLVTLLALYIGSTLISSIMSATTTDKTQRMLFMFLPLIAVVFVWSFPAGLLLYWITTNIWTAGQQGVLRMIFGAVKTPGLDFGGMAFGGGNKSSGSSSKKPAAKGSGKGDSSSKGKKGSSANTATKTSDGVKKASGGKPPVSPKKKPKRSGRRR